MRFHEYFRTRRIEASLPKRQLALAHGMSPTALSHIEHGRSLPRLDTLLTLGESLGYQVMVVDKDGSFILSKAKNGIALNENHSAAGISSRFAKILNRLSPAQTELAFKILKVILAMP